MSAQERDALARLIFESDAKVGDPSALPWERQHEAERDMYRANADAVLAAGWLPPGTDTARESLRSCARCGERPVIGGPEDLTCCDRCASQVGYEAALYDAQDAIAAIQPPNHHTRAWWGLRAAGAAVNAIRDRRTETGQGGA